MMKQEFEAIAGYEVSNDDYYKIIEPMYMASNLNKEEFVKCISKKRFALKPLNKIIKEMREIGEERKENCHKFYSREQDEKLVALIEEYIERKGLKGFVHYQIRTDQKWSCSFPIEVEIYSAKSYKTFEKIRIA